MITILSFNIRSLDHHLIELWSSFQLFYALLPAQWRTPTTAISSQRSVLKAVTLSLTLSTSTSGSVEQTSPFPSARCCKVCAFFFFPEHFRHCLYCKLYNIISLRALLLHCLLCRASVHANFASLAMHMPSVVIIASVLQCVQHIYTILLRKPSFLYPRRHFSLEGWSSCSNWASQRHRQHAPGRNRRQLR